MEMREAHSERVRRCSREEEALKTHEQCSAAREAALSDYTKSQPKRVTISSESQWAKRLDVTRSSNDHEIVTSSAATSNNITTEMVNGVLTMYGPGPWGEGDYKDRYFSARVIPAIHPFTSRSQWREFYEIYRYNQAAFNENRQQKTSTKFNFSAMVTFKKHWCAELVANKTQENPSYVPRKHATGS